MERFFGQVVKQPVGVGSKSERQAICLAVGTKRFILRRPEGNPFHDEELAKLVGKNIRADGHVVGGATLLLSTWAEVA